ncbi:MAG: DnaA/Hda family protein, partial [Pseudomonadota bacterium]
MTSSCLQTPTQFSLDITLPKFATFETFIDSSEGQLLSDLLKLKQENQSEPQQYFIWGAKSTGKTHLLQAICNQLADSKRDFMYLPMKE